MDSIGCTELRIGTLNVHSWVDERCQASVSEVIEIIRANSLHVLCMQEVSLSEDEHNSLLRDLRYKIPLIGPDGQKLSDASTEGVKSELHTVAEAMNGVSVYAAAYPVLGNAISTRLKVLNWGKKVMKVLYREARSMVHMEAEVAEGIRVRICCVHLDHIEECYRIEQMELALAVIHQLQLKDPLPILLCGDFNALKRSDYSDSQWREIAATRAYSHWESPRSELLDLLLTNNGFVDLREKAERVTGSLSTCRFNTRIDFILGKNLPSDWQVTWYHHESASLVSDHKPVWAHIRIPRTNANVST